MKVNICGIPHTVIECEDKFDVDAHFGQIDYKACEIRVNKDMATEAKEETICHEMIHGILVIWDIQNKAKMNSLCKR